MITWMYANNKWLILNLIILFNEFSLTYLFNATGLVFGLYKFSYSVLSPYYNSLNDKFSSPGWAAMTFLPYVFASLINMILVYIFTYLFTCMYVHVYAICCYSFHLNISVTNYHKLAQSPVYSFIEYKYKIALCK